MAERPRGKTLSLHAGRKIVYEILAHAKHVPTVTATRVFHLGSLQAARRATQPAISWVALFAKSYGIAGQTIPELRHNWLKYPYTRIYEHPTSECVVIVEREWQGQLAVLFGKVHGPEQMPLREFDTHIARFRDAPVWEVSPFRQLLRVARLPRFLRWFAFWSTLNWSGYKRCKRMGTFTISSLGSLGAELRSPLLPLTGYLTFGPINEQGEVIVSLTFDHRVMDGRHAARALEEMERVLNTTLLQELQTLSTSETPTS